MQILILDSFLFCWCSLYDFLQCVWRLSSSHILPCISMHFLVLTVRPSRTVGFYHNRTEGSVKYRLQYVVRTANIAKWTFLFSSFLCTHLGILKIVGQLVTIFRKFTKLSRNLYKIYTSLISNSVYIRHVNAIKLIWPNFRKWNIYTAYIFCLGTQIFPICRQLIFIPLNK